MSSNSDARSVTFDVLAKHESAEAADVLIQALGSDDPEARRLAAAAVVKRRGQLSILEVIRQVEELGDECCEEFSQSPDRFRTALNQCFSHSDDETQLAAIRFICRTANFSQVGVLVEQLDSDDGGVRDAVSRALVELAENVATRLYFGDMSCLPGFTEQDLQQHRNLMVQLFDAKTSDFAGLEHPRPLLRAMLTLGRAGDEPILNILHRRGTDCRTQATDVLVNAEHPSIYRLICESLERHSPPPAIFDAVQRREDLEFLTHFLDWLPKKPAKYLETNLSHLSDLPWLHLSHSVLGELPLHVHDRLVALINLVQMEELHRTELKAWIVHSSGAVGRAAASDVLESLPPEEAQQILYDALTNEDPDVEAWATTRLRSQKVPDTFQHLVTRLDKQTDVVRDAARGELSSFDVDRLLELFPQLTPDLGRRCGQALLKIHPDAPLEIRRELSHPYRWRRLRATRAVAVLGLIEEVFSGLVALLADPEPTVRRTVIETLSSNPSPGTVAAIRGTLDDESRSVRDTARQALRNLQDQLEKASL